VSETCAAASCVGAGARWRAAPYATVITTSEHPTTSAVHRTRPCSHATGEQPREQVGRNVDS